MDVITVRFTMRTPLQDLEIQMSSMNWLKHVAVKLLDGMTIRGQHVVQDSAKDIQILICHLQQQQTR